MIPDDDIAKIRVGMVPLAFDSPTEERINEAKKDLALIQIAPMKKKLTRTSKTKGSPTGIQIDPK